MLLFTDICGSTALKARHGAVAYKAAAKLHNTLFERLAAEEQLTLVKNTGDGYFARTTSIAAAVRFALILQYHLGTMQWPSFPLATRVGIHAGEVADITTLGQADVLAPAADLVARVMSLAVGGQILLTRGPFDEARHFVRAHPDVARDVSLTWLAHGPYLFKGYEEPVEIFEVGLTGHAPLVAPPDGEKAKRAVRPGDEQTLGWRPAEGQEIPSRPGWRLGEQLGVGGFGEVWVGEHVKFHQRRAFKFCFDDERLRALKREVTLVRLLRTALGDRDDIVRFHELKLDEPPFYLESDLAPHGNLLQWAEKQGGLDKIPVALRISLVANTAAALAAAHSIGVLHKDIKPTNILIFDAPDGTIRPRLADFGIGTLTDLSILAQQGITGAGFTRMTIQHSTGTPTYSPPEYLAGRPFTIQGDIYGLGVLLYQLVTGKPTEPLAPGWERDIADPLLREDIAMCVDGDPGRRFPSAADLAERLMRLDERRAEAEQEKARISALERRAYLRGVARTAAAALAVITLVVTLAAYAFHQARVARESRGRAELSALAESQARGKSDETLTKMQLQRAEELFSADDASGGLTYLAAVLRRHPEDRITGARLLSALRDRSYARPLLKPFQHNGSVLGLAWSPDGKRLVTVTMDRICVWDTATGQLVVAPIAAEPAAALRGVSFSKDGRRFVAVGADSQVFDSETGRPVSAPLVHKGRGTGGGIPYALFFPDGKHILTATHSKEIKVWEVETGSQIAELKIDSFPESLAVHPDGVRVAVSTSNRSVILWDSAAQRVEHDWPRMENGPGGTDPQLIFSPDGTRLFEKERDLIVGYDLNTNERLPWDIQPPKYLLSFDLSPDSCTFAVVTGKHAVRFFSAKTGQYLSDEWQHSRYVDNVQYGANGTRILSMTDQTVQVRTAISGIPVCATLRVDSNIRCARLSDDGLRLAVGTEAGEVKLWEISASESKPLLFGPARSHPPFVLNSDESRIVTSGGSQAMVWDFKTGRPVGIIEHGESFWSLNFQPGGNTFLTGGATQTLVRTWDCNTGKTTKPDFNGHIGGGGLDFSPDGKLFMVGTRVWNFATGKPVTKSLGGRIDTNSSAHHNSPKITLDGKRVVMVEGQDHVFAVKIFDIASDQLAVLGAGYDTPVNSMTLAANARIFAAGSTDGQLRVWRTEDASPVTPWFRHEAAVSSISFSPDGSLLATSSLDQTARVWAIPSGKPVCEPIQHAQPVLWAEFCPDGRRVATYSQDGSVRVWDALTGRALTDHLPVHVQSHTKLGWTRDGTHLIGNGVGLVHSWEVPHPTVEPPHWLADWAEAVAGQRLDAQGKIERISDDEAANVATMIAGLPGDDLYARTAKWFYANPSERPISPDSKITQAEYTKLLAESESSRAAKAALHIAPGNSRAWARYVELVISSDSISLLIPELEFFLSRAEMLDPREPWVWRARGALLNLLGDSEKALAAMRQSAELDPNDWRTQRLLAFLLAKHGESAQAIDAASRALANMESSGYDVGRRRGLVSLRLDMFRKLGRVEEAAPDNIELHGIAARDPKATGKQIDLSAYYVLGLGEDARGVTSQEQPFIDLPHGLQTMQGVTFDIRGMVQLKHEDFRQDLPSGVQNIRIGEACRSLQFLHSCLSIPNTHAALVANYLITYDDGTTETAPVRAGMEIGNIYRSDGKSPRPPLVLGWMGETADSRRRGEKEKKPITVCLYKMTWQNPHPEKPVRSVDFVSTDPEHAAPVLFAVTAE